MRGGAAPEDDEADQVDGDEQVAQRAVDVCAAPPQHHQHDQRDHEVGVVVVLGDDRCERVATGQPVIERALGIDAQRLLEVQHAARVGQRRVQAQRREVRGGVVHPQQPHQHQALHPQARAPDLQLGDALAKPVVRRGRRG
jgi:hypothetical protein